MDRIMNMLQQTLACGLARARIPISHIRSRGRLKGGLLCAGFALMLGAAQHSTAAERVDSGLMAMLPQYCKYSMIYRDKVPGGNDPAKIEHWRGILGPGYSHIHHYCNGLIQTNMAMLRADNKKSRVSLLEISLSEFDYVIRNVPEDFVLLPEILTRKGENLIRMGRGPESIQVLQRAMRIKPDYWPPYAYLSDYYKDIGEREKARQTLEKGLARSAGSKALTSRLKSLDGSAGRNKN